MINPGKPKEDSDPGDETPEEEERPLTEEERIYAWRLLRLLDAGFDHQDAEILALRSDVDVRKACRLLELGCPMQTALEILL